MEFKIINKENWERKEYFDHYYSDVPCTYSTVVKIGVTNIVKNKLKLYPAMLYFITKTVNKYEEFRTSMDSDGNIGIFDFMNPCYTVFNKETSMFTNIWTEYSENMEKFFANYNEDIKTYSKVRKMIAKDNVPENNFPVSMIPWFTFEGFNLNLKNGYNYLLPIFTIGKYENIDGKYILPLAIQVHHSVCDGYHVSRFVESLQKEIFEINK